MKGLHMIDRDFFFAKTLEHFGALEPKQIEGFDRILDEWERRGLSDERWLAYMLATVWHETARRMQPVREAGSEAYLRRKPYWPYVGEGLVQVTWKRNYEKFGARKPGDLLAWPLALRALFDGMITGEFTGRQLSDYFNHRADDPVKARRIINGMDRAMLVATYHRAFLAALGGEAAQSMAA
jgi:hypothetical protein